MAEDPTNEAEVPKEKESWSKSRKCWYRFCVSRRKDYSGKDHIFGGTKKTDPKSWLEFIKKLPPNYKEAKQLGSTHVFCSRHFEDRFIIKAEKFEVDGKQYEYPLRRWRLTPDAYPSLFDPPSEEELANAVRRNKSGKRTVTNSVPQVEGNDDKKEAASGSEDDGDNESLPSDVEAEEIKEDEKREWVEITTAMEKAEVAETTENNVEAEIVFDEAELSPSEREAGDEDKALEFFVNASKNVHPKETPADSSIEEVAISSDDDKSQTPSEDTKPVNSVKLPRKRKQVFPDSAKSSPKKSKTVEVIDLDSDSEDALSATKAFFSSVHNKSPSTSSITISTTTVPPSNIQNPIVLLNGASSFAQVNTTAPMTPLVSGPAPVLLLSQPIMAPAIASTTAAKPQPLGNTGTNFVIIQPPPQAQANGTHSTVFTASDLAKLTMPTPDWNVNTYKEGFSISETVMSVKAIEIIRRSITILNNSGSNIRFSVFGNEVDLKTKVNPSSVAEIQQILNRFSTIPICTGLDLDSVIQKHHESWDALSKFRKHVDQFYRSLQCSLLMFNPNNHPLLSKSWTAPKLSLNQLLCRNCAEERTALGTATGKSLKKK